MRLGTAKNSVRKERKIMGVLFTPHWFHLKPYHRKIRMQSWRRRLSYGLSTTVVRDIPLSTEPISSIVMQKIIPDLPKTLDEVINMWRFGCLELDIVLICIL